MKKNFTFILLILTIAAFTPENIFASGKNVGTKSAQFLKMAVGARAAAMGEAFTAAGEDAFVMDWNPAALTNVRYRSFAAMHELYVADMSLSYLSYAESAGDMGAWGMAAKYFNYGSIQGTDTHGNLASNMSPFDAAVSIAFSCYITGFNKEQEDRFIMGAAGKFITSKIDNTDTTLSADIGILSPWFFNRHLRLAFAGQNLIGSLRFDKEKNDLPMVFRVGSIAKITKILTLTADAISYDDYDAVFAAGAELNLAPSRDFALSLRGGMNTRAKDESLKGSNNLSLGAGIKFGDVYSLDYAYSPFGEIGDIHRFSLSVNFKKPVIVKRRRRGI